MYEKEIAEAAAVMSQQTWRKTASTKSDRTFTLRIAEILERLEQLGFGGWTTGVVPVDSQGNTKWGEPRCKLMGCEVATSDPVYLDLHNHFCHVSPKYIAFSLRRVSNDRGILLGVNIGSLRMTDLRTRVSYYDDAQWSEVHFGGQLRADALNKKMPVTPEVIQRQLATATAHLAEIGITDPKHALLPRPYDDMYSIVLQPYLVGMYGAMPCAIRMSYKDQGDRLLRLEFYIVSPDGLCKLDFGHLHIDASGTVVDKEMDIGKLLAGPVR